MRSAILKLKYENSERARWGKLKKRSGNELAWPRTQRPPGGPRTAPRVDLGGLKGQQGRCRCVWKVKRVEGCGGCSQDSVLVSFILWLLSRGQQVPGEKKAICKVKGTGQAQARGQGGDSGIQLILEMDLGGFGLGLNGKEHGSPRWGLDLEL